MLGKPEKGQMVENMLLRMAQTGQIMGKLGENELINILESINQQTAKTTTVKVGIFFLEEIIHKFVCSLLFYKEHQS